MNLTKEEEDDNMLVFNKVRNKDGTLNNVPLTKIIGMYIHQIVEPFVKKLILMDTPANIKKYAKNELMERRAANFNSIMAAGELSDLIQNTVTDLYSAFTKGLIDEAKITKWSQFQKYVLQMFDGTINDKVIDVKGGRKSDTASHASNEVMPILRGDGKVNQEGQMVRFPGDDGEMYIYKLTNPYDTDEQFKAGISKKVENKKTGNIDIKSKRNTDIDNDTAWSFVALHTGEKQATDAPEWVKGRDIVVGGKGNSRTSVMYDGEVYRLNKKSDRIETSEGKKFLPGEDNMVPPPEAPLLWEVEGLTTFSKSITDPIDGEYEEADEHNEVNAPDSYDVKEDVELPSETLTTTNAQLNQENVDIVARTVAPLVMDKPAFRKLNEIISFSESELVEIISVTISDILTTGKANKLSNAAVINNVKELISNAMSDSELAEIRRSNGNIGEDTDITAASAQLQPIAIQVVKTVNKLLTGLSRGDFMDLYSNDILEKPKK